MLQGGEGHAQGTMTGGIVRAHGDIAGKLLARVFKLGESHERSSKIVKSERIIRAHFQRTLEGLDCVLPRGQLKRDGSEFGVNIRVAGGIFSGVRQQSQGFFGVSCRRCGARLVLQNAHQSGRGVATSWLKADGFAQQRKRVFWTAQLHIEQAEVRARGREVRLFLKGAQKKFFSVYFMVLKDADDSKQIESTVIVWSGAQDRLKIAFSAAQFPSSDGLSGILQ